MKPYKVIGGGFIYQRDQDIYDFTKENGDVLSLGLEGLEEKWAEFVNRKG